MTPPDGAITSVQALRALVPRDARIYIYIASRVLGSIESFFFAGTYGIKIYRDGWKYRYIEVYRNEWAITVSCSVVDCNLRGGGYNDWFVFTDATKARAWANMQEKVA